jgi:hypothetical protein
MAAVQPGALAPGPDVTNKQTLDMVQQDCSLQVVIFIRNFGTYKTGYSMSRLRREYAV